MGNSKEVGFGIIGCGMISGFHAQAIADAQGGRLIGVASRSAESARKRAESSGITYYTDDTEELIRHPDVDVVCITTPSGVHMEPAIMAAQAGKHIIVEKPLEITLERIDPLLRACEENNVKLAAIFQARFDPAASEIKKAVDSGRLGRLTVCDAYVKWYRGQDYYDEGGWKGTMRFDGGGALMNQSIHAIDLLQWLVGMPKQVSAFAGTLAHDIEVEDTAVACLRFPGGALGVIEGSTAVWPGYSRRIEISGENGSIALEDDRIVRWDFREKTAEDEAILQKYGEGNQKAPAGAGDPKAISCAGHTWQIQDMIDAIHENRPPRIEGKEGRKAVALIRAIYDSAEKGTIVDVP